MNLKELEEAQRMDIETVARETIEKLVMEANQKLEEAREIANKYEISFDWTNPFTGNKSIYSGIQEKLQDYWMSSSTDC